MDRDFLRKIFEDVEKKIKVFITVFFVFSMALFYSCEDGGHYAGSGEELLYLHSSHQKKEVCRIEGMALSRFGEDVDANILRVFITSSLDIFRVHHIRVTDENGERINFIMFKFPLYSAGGIDASIDNTNLLMLETEKFVKIYYDKEPVGGFVVEHNPFSKEIQFEFQKDLRTLRTLDNVCF
ncbi:MAG: hypothetical protein MJZ22_03685 [Candidatus Saccharibacteria bacterium]|nr:hypothetical protein [Candidatus Saccharibacteria bacterium]